MARKKNQQSGKGGGGNKPNPGKGKQVSKGLGKGTVQQSPPTSSKIGLSTRFALKNNGTNGDVTVTGSEIVGVCNSAGAGKMVFVADLNPSTWVSSRVARMIPLFETYRIESLRVTYIPSCPTTTGGLLYLYYDRDPNDPPISDVAAPANLARLMSNQNASAGQVWKPLTMSYKPSSGDLKAFYAAPVSDTGDLRLTSQGLVYGYTSSPIGSLAGGIFKFDYTIKLMTPTGPSLSKTSLTAWTYGTGTVPNYTNTTTPIGFSLDFGSTLLGTTSPAAAIIEILLEMTLNVLVDGVSKTLPQYTPLYMRSLGAGAFRIWASLTDAISGDSNFLLAPIGPVIPTSCWARLIVNLLANAMGET